MQINRTKALENLPEDTALLQALQLVGEEELIQENVADVTREFGNIVQQVVVEPARILTAQLAEGEAGEIVKPQILAGRTAGSLKQDMVARSFVHPLRQGCIGAQDRILGAFEDAIQAAQHDEGQDYLAVVRLLEIAAQYVGDGPDKSA